MTSFNPAAFAQHLVAWFRLEQRDLPWRRLENASDPYRVLVSEVMLQQTTVAAVAPKYVAFLRRFPTVESLAAATLDDVLAIWQGLGYYSRARNLHAAAQAVISDHGGDLPRDVAALSRLPGVGRYTLGAVASIAYNQRVPIVDANVARVLSRVRLIEGDVKSGQAHAQLWREAQALIEADEQIAPRELNPALMELGALICTPRNPKCDACPVANHCGAFATQRQNELPQLAPKREIVQVQDVCIYARRGEDVLMRQRSHARGIWWRGMWELPRTTVQSGETPALALQRLACELGFEVQPQRALKTLDHGVTHHAISLSCWKCELSGEGESSTRWLSWAHSEELAVPSTMRRLMRWLQLYPNGEARQGVLF